MVTTAHIAPLWLQLVVGMSSPPGAVPQYQAPAAANHVAGAFVSKDAA